MYLAIRARQRCLAFHWSLEETQQRKNSAHHTFILFSETLLFLCRSSIVNGPSDGDDSMFLLAQQKQFCAFVSQHLLCALRRVTDEGIVAPDDVYELPSSASSHNVRFKIVFFV